MPSHISFHRDVLKIFEWTIWKSPMNPLEWVINISLLHTNGFGMVCFDILYLIKSYISALLWQNFERGSTHTNPIIGAYEFKF